MFPFPKSKDLILSSFLGFSSSPLLVLFQYEKKYQTVNSERGNVKREMINTKYFSSSIPFPNDMSTLEASSPSNWFTFNSPLQTHSDTNSERNLCKISEIVTHLTVTCLIRFKFSGKDNFEWSLSYPQALKK